MKTSESIYNVGNDYAQMVSTKAIQPKPKPDPGPGPGPKPEPVWPRQYGALTFYKVDDKIICIINLAYDGTDSCTMPEAIEVDEIRIVHNKELLPGTVYTIVFPFDVSLEEVQSNIIDYHTEQTIKIYNLYEIKNIYNNTNHTVQHKTTMKNINLAAANGIHNGKGYVIYNIDTENSYVINITIPGKRTVYYRPTVIDIPTVGSITPENINTDIGYNKYEYCKLASTDKLMTIGAPYWYFNGADSKMYRLTDDNTITLNALSFYIDYPSVPEQHINPFEYVTVDVIDTPGNNTCDVLSNIDVYNAEELNIDKSYVTNGLTYVRTFKDVVGTVCFPCDLLASEIKNATVYSLNKVIFDAEEPKESKQYKITEECLTPVDKINANTPYIIIANENGAQLDIQMTEYRKVSTLDPVVLTVPVENKSGVEFEFRISWKHMYFGDMEDWEPKRFYGIVGKDKYSYHIGELAMASATASIRASMAYLKLRDI